MPMKKYRWRKTIRYNPDQHAGTALVAPVLFQWSRPNHRDERTSITRRRHP